MFLDVCGLVKRIKLVTQAIKPMLLEPVLSQSAINVVKHGKKSAAGKQRMRCRNVDYPRRSFIHSIFASEAIGTKSSNKERDMAMNGSGIEDTARC